MKVIVSDEASVDLDRLQAFLFEKDARAARRAIAAIVSAIDSLEIFPERGRPSAAKGSRDLTIRFGKSAYIVRYVYRASRRTVMIVRVWHGREDRA